MKLDMTCKNTLMRNLLIQFLLIYVFLCSTFSSIHPADVSHFLGTWPMQTYQNTEITAYICEDPNTPDKFQGRYVENGHTIGFLISNYTEVLPDNSNGRVTYGYWYEAGGHSGTFEMKINDVTVPLPSAEMYMWYDYQNPDFDNANRYSHYSLRSIVTKTSSMTLSISDCFATSAVIDINGQWTRNSIADEDAFYICTNGTVVGGRFFDGYWNGVTQNDGSIINGRWVSLSESGAFILKIVNNDLYGSFLLGIDNQMSTTTFEFGPLSPITKVNDNSPTPNQCIDENIGFAGRWTETLHGQSMYICTKPDGTLYGSYTRKVLVNNEEKVMPVGIIVGKVDSKFATGDYYEAGRNQHGKFEWQLASNLESFTGFFWSSEALVEGIKVMGMEWNETRTSWVASPFECLVSNFNADESSIEGYWSMKDFPTQPNPVTGGTFTNLSLTICKENDEIRGIYRHKGDWISNTILWNSITLGYFKEHWEPLGVKIAGNNIFRLLHTNFAIEYMFEGENNDISNIGHFRTHSRIAGNLNQRNCTPVFISSSNKNSIGSVVYMAALVSILVLCFLFL